MNKYHKDLSELNDDDLKKEKLISEIKDLNKPWYKQHYFYTFLATFFVLIFGAIGGFFNWDKYQLKKDLAKLETEISKRKNEQDSLIKLNLSLINKYDSTKNALNDKDSIIAELKKWITIKQPPVDLKQEVLSFVNEIRILIDEYNKINSFSNHPVLCNIYNSIYQQKAILFRIKLEYYLYGKNSIDDFEGFRNYTTAPASIISMRYVAEDLEVMANMIPY
jgi:cell division protein FtsL